jgi:Mg2+-importing ATPase
MMQDISAFWTIPEEDLLGQLNSGLQGLTDAKAEKRQKEYISRRLRPRRETSPLRLFLNQFESPIILLLIFAALLSIYLLLEVEASLILIIIFISGFLGFWQERGAANAVSDLLAIVQIKVDVLRNGKDVEIPQGEILKELITDEVLIPCPPREV